MIFSLWVFGTEIEEATRCLQCHGGTAAVEPSGNSKRAPLLPKKFTVDWQMYEFASKERPPFSKIPSPHEILRGVTYYDGSRRTMTEIYNDKCIDILPTGRDFRRQFTSIKDKTYLIRSAPDLCCLWNKPGFHAPRPDVIRNMTFEKNLKIAGKMTDVWLLQIPMPGPFGYAFIQNTDEPATFAFPVISGWVQQNFKNFIRGKVSATAFILPAQCTAVEVPVCVR